MVPPLSNGVLKRRLPVLAAAVVVLAIAALGWWFVIRVPEPPAQAGDAWLARFTALVTSPRLLAARGAAVPAMFPGVAAVPTSGCVTEWRQTARADPFILSQNLEVGRLEKEGCEQAQFGQLTAVLRQSEGVNPGAMVERLTARFGRPTVSRDSSLYGIVTYSWNIQSGVYLDIEEAVRPGGAATFKVSMLRFYGGATTLPTAAEGDRWMDGTVALLTGAALPAARGMAAVRLVDGTLVADRLGDASDCVSRYTSNRIGTPPIANRTELVLKPPADGTCDESVVDYLSYSVWQNTPVTVAALVRRIDAKLGSAAVTRDFNLDVVDYEWKTAFGTKVGVTEFIGIDHLLSVRAWRS